MSLPTTQNGWDNALPSRAYLDGKPSNGEATLEIKNLFADLGRAVLGSARPLGAGYTEPVSGGRYHAGLDLKAPVGTAVRTVVDGVVVRADAAENGHGFDAAVVMRGDDGHYWVYGHVNDTPLDGGLVGSRIAAGEVVGTVRESTSRWIDPHVHLAVLDELPNAYSYQLIGGYGHFTSEKIALAYTDNPLQSYHEWRGGTAVSQPLKEVDGTRGADTLVGGAGDEVLTGGGGGDKLYGGGGNDLLLGDAGNDEIKGAAGSDLLRGGRGNDVLHGGGGDDKLYGELGNDFLYAGDGQDYLNGGAGIDHLYGHGGADRFDFDAVAHSPTANAAWDVIDDFQPGIDTIDLKSIDADVTTAGNQQFRFVAVNHEGAAPGEVWVDEEGGYIHASVDARSGWDLTIGIPNGLNVTANDFIL